MYLNNRQFFNRPAAPDRIQTAAPDRVQNTERRHSLLIDFVEGGDKGKQIYDKRHFYL